MAGSGSKSAAGVVEICSVVTATGAGEGEFRGGSIGGGARRSCCSVRHSLRRLLLLPPLQVMMLCG